jgi:hypothetical protein
MVVVCRRKTPDLETRHGSTQKSMFCQQRIGIVEDNLSFSGLNGHSAKTPQLEVCSECVQCGAPLHVFKAARDASADLPGIVCYEKQSDWGGLWNDTWRTSLDAYSAVHWVDHNEAIGKTAHFRDGSSKKVDAIVLCSR